ncbi:hypothetical protein BH10ACI4_BH10ACI4_18070 [soil metagenome]
MSKSSFSRLITGFAVFSLPGFIGCSLNTAMQPLPAASRLTASVYGGSQPVSGATIQLYAMGTSGNGSPSVPLLTTPLFSDTRGSFTLPTQISCPDSTNQVYITATGGNPGLPSVATNLKISLMALLGVCSSLGSSTQIKINEVTTVAAVWSFRQFMASATRIGSSAGSIDLQNAAVNSASLIDFVSGEMKSSPTNDDATIRAINSAADVLSVCVNSDGIGDSKTLCGRLFSSTTVGGGAVPTNTIEAALSVALHPNLNVQPLFLLMPGVAPFQPTTANVPEDWSLGYSYSPPTLLRKELNPATVFLGDSITNGWRLPLNNRGISGQELGDMLNRTTADVVGHGYTRMVLLGGTNDIWRHSINIPNALITILKIADLAKADGIQVVLCLIPPLHPDGIDFDEVVQTFNVELVKLAAKEKYLVVDYFTPMAGHPEYFLDGVHPSIAGYAVMESALSKTLAR